MKQGDTKMNKCVLLCSICLAMSLSVLKGQADLLLFSDNFNAPDIGNFDNSDQTGRRAGVLASDVQLRSARVQHSIADNAVVIGNVPGSGRIRFHDANNLTTLWNFANPKGGNEILAAGEFTVEFDWTPINDTSVNWVSFNLGFSQGPEPQIRVNDTATDFGILFRNNGAVQYFDNGVDTVPTETFAPFLGVHHAVLKFSLSSFADGSIVTVDASVDGTPVLSNFPFQLDSNAGALYMELGALDAGVRFDNFQISTVIPEPHSLLLFGLGAIGCVVFRRRAR